MDFKTVEFDCKFKMQVAINNNMTEEEIIEKIMENFEFVHQYGASECDFSDEYSAWMAFDDIKNVKIVD